MLLFDTCRPFFRLVAIMTILTFFPSAVGVWNALPLSAEAGAAEVEVPQAPSVQEVYAGASAGPKSVDVEHGPVPLGRPVASNSGTGEGYRRMQLARADLPVADDLIAALQAAQGASLDYPVPDPAGPPEAAAALQAAEAARLSGDYPGALSAYVGIINSYPGTSEALKADTGLATIGRAVVEPSVSAGERDAVDASLPAWEAMGPYGKYAIQDYFGITAEAALKNGNMELAVGRYQKTRGKTLQLIREHPEAPFQIAVVGVFYEMEAQASDYGLTDLSEVVNELHRLTRLETPCIARMSAHASLTHYEWYRHHNRGAADLHHANVLAEARQSYVQDILDDPYTAYWIKGHITYVIGVAYASLERYQEALRWYEEKAEWTRRGGDAARIAYHKAIIFQHLYPEDSAEVAGRYQDFLLEHPSSELVPKALLRLAGVFLTAGDYRGAVAFYREVIQSYPGTPQAVAAGNDLDFVLSYLYDSQEVYRLEPVDGPPLAKLCGPEALHELLALRGVEASVEELAEEAGTDDTGTSMQGLIEAAALHGCSLSGVKASALEEVGAPFIAHVDGEHFVFVTGFDDESVFAMEAGLATSIVRRDFESAWAGHALSPATSRAMVASSLAPRVLEAIRGGTSWGDGGPPSEPPCPPRTCDKRNPRTGRCCKYEDCTAPDGGGGEGSGGGGPTRGPVMYFRSTEGGPCSNGRCDQDATRIGGSSSHGGGSSGRLECVHAYSGVASPGVDPKIFPMATMLTLDPTDAAISLRGPMALVFQRQYLNEKGYPNGAYTDSSLPWSNTIGEGWTHNLNVHIRTSEPNGSGIPETAVLFDESGTARTYSYFGTGWGADFYARSSEGVTSEKGVVFYRTVATGAFTMRVPGETTYEFTAPTADSYRYARLEAIKDASGNAISFAYDGAVGAGRLTKVSGPSGDVQHLRLSYSGSLITKVELKSSTAVLESVDYAYNDSDELTKVTDDQNNDVTFAYASDASASGSRFLTKITDKAGNDVDFTWSFGQNGDGEWEAYRIDLDNCQGLRTRYDRNISSSVCTVTNSVGGTARSKYVYTPRGSDDPSRIKYEDYYYGDLSNYERWSYEYDTNYDLTKEKGPGATTLATYSYTAKGRVSTSAGMDGAASTFHYASSSDLYPTRVTESDGTDSYYYYDASWRVTKVTHPAVASSGHQMVYDAYGQVITKTDPLGHHTVYAYDGSGNNTAVTDPNGNSATMYYDVHNNLTRITDPRGKDTYHYYAYAGCGGCGNGGGVLTKVRDPLGNETEFEYDALGLQTKVTDAMDVATDYEYDALGRLTEVEFPSGSGVTQAMAYDDIGRVTSVTDSDGKTTYSYYHFLGDLTKTSDAVGDTTYTYDSLKRLSTVTDGEGSVFTYGYYSTGQLNYVNYDGTAFQRYLYDAKGRATKIAAGLYANIDPTENFYSDTTGLLTRVRYTSGANTYDAYYYYDGRQALTKISDWMGGGGLRYAYDAGGRLTRITDYDGGTLDYTYDAAGNVLTMSDYHGHETVYTYTDVGRVSTVTAPGSKMWAYDYNVLGQATKIDLPNGMETCYGFDSGHRLSKIEHKDGTSVLKGWTYALTDGGDIATMSAQDGSKWAYEYDGRSRLTKAERYDTDGTSLLHRYSYTYDDADNMLTKAVYDAGADSTTSTVFAYGDANLLTSQSVGGTTTSFAYDDWGRMTSKSDGTYSATYAYRYGDKLYSITSDFPSEGNATYQYDGAGKRRQRTAGGTTTQYRWDLGWTVVNEEDALGDLTRTYVGRSTAHVDGTNPSTGTWRFYVHDHLGSTRAAYNSDKTQYAALEHDPYGEVYASSGSVSDITRRYTGHDWDDAAELYYAPYRYYAPGLARWISRDPLGMVDGPNVYAYVGGMPANNVDLSGGFIIIDLIEWFWNRYQCTKARNKYEKCRKNNCPPEACPVSDPEYIDDILDKSDPRKTPHPKTTNPKNISLWECIQQKCGKELKNYINKCTGIEDLPNLPTPSNL